eukprot:Nk52_evm32s262 gene=Nk52_evmTU32s262
MIVSRVAGGIRGLVGLRLFTGRGYCQAMVHKERDMVAYKVVSMHVEKLLGEVQALVRKGLEAPHGRKLYLARQPEGLGRLLELGTLTRDGLSGDGAHTARCLFQAGMGLEKGILDKLARVEEVDLSGNNLESKHMPVIGILLSNSPAIKRVNLGDNPFHKFPVLPVGLQLGLQELDMSNCDLKMIHHGNTPPHYRLPSLQSLDLGGNKLVDTKGLGRIAPNLQRLSVAGNSISDIGFLGVPKGQLGDVHAGEQFPHLTHLDVSGNNMRYFRKMPAIVDVHRLTSLNVSGNNVSEVSRIFGQYCHVEQLELTQFLCRQANMTKFPVELGKAPRLEFLDLSKNKNMSVDEGLTESSFSSLRHLNVQYCTGLGDEVFESECAFGSVERLNAEGCELTKIPSFLLCGSSPITHLNLNANRWLDGTFDIGALLDGCLYLKVLDISRGKIEKLGVNGTATKTMREGKISLVDTLRISGNRLDTIPAWLMERLQHLNVLDASMNAIISLPAAVAMPRLEKVFLNGNRLKEASSGVFLRSVRTLSLGHNSLTKESDLLREFPVGLRELNLEGNNICDFEWLKSTGSGWQSSVQYLELSKNKVERFPMEWLYLFEKLEHLALEGNSLTTLGLNAVDILPCLKNIDLSNNLLSSFYVPDYHPRPIEFLGLKGNRFEAFDLDMEVFSKLSHIDLSFNNMTTMSLSMGSGNKCSLRVLELQNNSLTNVIKREKFRVCVDPYSLGLQHINLAHNHLSSFPRGLCTEYDLVSLDISYNRFTKMPILSYFWKHLTSLNAKGNGMKLIDDDAFKHVWGLRSLDLHDNQLRKLSSSLASCQHLSYLDASNNELEGKASNLPLPFNSLSTLKLSHNRLLSAPFLNYHPAWCDNRIAHLDCSHNRIRVVETAYNRPHKYHFTSSLQTLNLAHNDLHTFEFPYTWAQSLYQLDLNSNKLTHLTRPLYRAHKLKNISVKHNRLKACKLDYMPSLRKLDITGNPLVGTFLRDIESNFPSPLPSKHRSFIDYIASQTLQKTQMDINRPTAHLKTLLILGDFKGKHSPSVEISGNVALQTLIDSKP